MKLVIVESPGKVKAIQAILGPGYRVLACAGHIRDLPRRGLQVDVENAFTETYEVMKDRHEIVAQIRLAAREAEVIYLATDPDREGEAIAWHITGVLPPQDRGKVRRITFNQITAQAIKAAVEEPRGIDHRLVNAQRARRVLDRLAGYQVSPLLRTLGVRSERPLSAGRVQTTALRLIVERERARREFASRTFWHVDAHLQKDGAPPFRVRMTRPAVITEPDDLSTTLDELNAAAHWQVSQVEEKAQRRCPPAPFTTSTLQQEASRRLKLNPRRTQRTAQALYESGAITYPRTDATHVAPEARVAARVLIESAFGNEYLPAEPPTYPSRAGAQEAHEAIRPVDLALVPEKLEADPDQSSLYRLIWQRFVASQMAPATGMVVEVQIEAGDGEAPLPYGFCARSLTPTFEGYQAVYQDVRDDDEQPGGEGVLTDLPPLASGDRLTLRALEAREKRTQPPRRFTQARLIAHLDRVGIGRPGTFASSVETVLDRGYARMETHHVVPTPLGEVVCDLLVGYFPHLFALDFTAAMEEQLDRIARGEASYAALLAAFYERLVLASEAVRRAARQRRSTGEACPICSQPLVVRRGRRGDFVGCSAWPDCAYTRALEKEMP